MESVNKIENKLATMYKGLPHLPADVKKWIAQNVWWMAIVSVVFSVFGVISLIAVTFFASAVLVGFGGYAGAAVAAAGGFALLSVGVSIAFMIVELIVMGMAISPLHSMQKKGWTFIFIAALVQAASYVVSFLYSFNLFSLVWNLLILAVGVYFLFEIRDHFAGKKDKK
jgi:hypothetical protein